jgi:L-cysteate sulfo-lyase
MIRKLNLDRFPRVQLMDGPTPIQRLHRIERILGDRSRGIRIWAKRDDFGSLGGGGNKLRKQEFLLGQALSERCDTIIAVGGVQSNFARLTAAACAKLGLDCELVLSQMVPRDNAAYQQSGNVLLDRLMGARLHFVPKGDDPGELIDNLTAEISGQGKRAFIGTLGGSTPVGCLGYVACAFEIAEQSERLGVAFDHIVIPNGSGGTHAGLAAGTVAAGLDPAKIRAHTVLSARGSAIRATTDKVNAVLELLVLEERIGPEQMYIDETELGGGYGIPTTAMVDAVRLMARSEGLLLDPVYSGKAFAGLLSDIDAGGISPGSNVLFVITGGSPGLYAYPDVFATPAM